MALLQMNFMSEAMMRTMTVNVVLPADKLLPPGTPKPERRPYKTLYLLNGVMGNYTDWANATNIQILAEENDLAVVMPGGENLFYLDYEPIHAMYGEFVGRELVEFTRKIFPLSQKREDTFIGGVSMGGYGALRNGMKYAENFGKIIGLSSAAMFYDLEKRTDDPAQIFFEKRKYMQKIFGDFSQVENSDKNPVWTAKELIKTGRPVPEVYMACGTADFLLPVNRRLQDELKTAGADVTYREAPGEHGWDFWREEIKYALDWLPLGSGAAGINSGNIGR